MARIEKTFVADFGRDKGKKFLLTEMSPRAGHKWATRVLLAFLSSGMEIPEDVAQRGLAGLATIATSALGKLDPEQLEPLMEELLTCVQSVQEKGVRKLIDDDFEEIATIFQLQKAVFALHVEPFTSGVLLTSESQKVPEQDA